ncbi:hypothetical protein, partial [Halocynthiibacter sp.]|uniref:hypothetical protein n=1 Tax=Halocynthiibacter sp. TaxID=1979210 RepID=UPI003C62C137
RLSVIDGEVSDRRTFAGLAVKAPDGQWHCNTYVGPDSDMNTYGFSEKENGDVFPSSIYVTVSGHNSSTGLNICVGEDMQACPYLVGASE